MEDKRAQRLVSPQSCVRDLRSFISEDILKYLLKINSFFVAVGVFEGFMFKSGNGSRVNKPKWSWSLRRGGTLLLRCT